MYRLFDVGDRVVCRESGVVGTVVRFYTPTSCEEQTLVKTDDGREYHALTRTWAKKINVNINTAVHNVTELSTKIIKDIYSSKVAQKIFNGGNYNE